MSKLFSKVLALQGLAELTLCHFLGARAPARLRARPPGCDSPTQAELPAPAMVQLWSGRPNCVGLLTLGQGTA